MQYHQSESHHKELAACTDEQLCAMAAAGDREAEELLVTRYYGMVRACARPLFLAGGDGEDRDSGGHVRSHSGDTGV